MGEIRNARKTVFGKPEKKRQLERHSQRYEGNIKRDLQERGCEDTDWIRVDQGRV
jgi:hypothetical protein